MMRRVQVASAVARQTQRRGPAANFVRAMSAAGGADDAQRRLDDMLTQLMIKVDKLEKAVLASSAASPAASAPADAPKKPVVPLGKSPRGFVDFHRKPEPYRPSKIRLQDWSEINSVGHDDPSEQKRQAARCMDCGTPFCQTHTGCPINNLIPEWNDLVLNDQWLEAIDRLHKTNNFPEFTGRVCPAPCEGACVAGLIDEPVTIKNMEYAIVERAWKEGWIQPRMVPEEDRSGKKIAVIGSGPAGLAAADQLNQLGHTVTVMEREDKVGGLLYYGIPNPKLDKRTVDRRVDLLRQEGIVFETNVEVGVNRDAEELRSQYDAVVLAVGATKPRLLSCPGGDLKGVYPAMEFLTANQKDLKLDDKGFFRNQWTNELISAEGKNVVVIGGGDTGTDCIGTSLRHFCKSLVNLELMPQNPTARDAKVNPWPLYPKVHKLDYGHEENVTAFGSDPRQYSVQTKRLLDDGKGNVKGVVTVGVEFKNGAFQEIPGTEQTIPADLVLLAMGFVSPEENLINALSLDADERGNIKAEYGEYTTPVPGVFAAGDCRRGQSLVVWAINEGRGAAEAVDKFLMSDESASAQQM
ncbi:Glutamate synthase NADH [Hondaea fermentalgiana]|uniref:Glutamate synthase NADH n=1 Tax=Hondaea fermentalgiana TaxID=2315210 RepID=A0A2R5GGM2_9STRA|nr:Glutamate synthase NADH [Hondaea fermentalgiana]|eukprot:GBG27803.1 Glutamate synthase NADH [Hondaea fermentalgiana]